MKKIVIKVDKEAKITVETSGYSGKACQDATKAFEAAHKVLNDTPTDEMRRNQIKGNLNQQELS